MSVTAAQGYAAAGLHCGIKASGDPDLALVATADHKPVAAAGVFTQNLACAGPVQVSKRHLLATRGQAAAVVLNSGNANCATGTDVEIAEQMCTLTALELRCRAEEVLVCSTGLIGIPLGIGPLQAGIPAAATALDAAAGGRAARAIMTTDTVPKQAAADGDGWRLGGMAKGAAMLAPNMATMLAVLTTDAAVAPGDLQRLLGRAVSMTFNRIVVDGCTSTNDSVLVLANGIAGPPDLWQFAMGLAEVCGSLAMQMVRDAEGHTKVVTISVEEAASVVEAERAARKLAGSLLVKTSFYGADPYWGRVLSELGVAGVSLDVDAVTIAYDDVVVSKGRAPTGADASAITQQSEFTLTCRLGAGPHSYFVHTNDLTHAYVDENMGTS
ncbi:MAG: glutamate N-acetyltransferase / amino-acid N-acetyltransferase [Acidimicrobiaceae bacterium]|jgi:glutamate N-acetyltransferase/amino-acid N-acetyltransferase